MFLQKKKKKEIFLFLNLKLQLNENMEYGCRGYDNEVKQLNKDIFMVESL